LTVRAAGFVGLLLSILFVAAVGQGHDARLRLVAFGDVNLGRTLGKRLLREEPAFPFERLKEMTRSADVAMVNLESLISDQNGETEHPRSNYIFCAPPVAVWELKDAGVDVAVTANNHAFDYGVTGVAENIRFLAAAGIMPVGSVIEPEEGMPPGCLERNGIRIAVVAYTASMNFRSGWSGRISAYDSARVARDVRNAREHADVVVANYHGGAEYVDAPTWQARAHMRFLIEAGADVVIGHHPHYLQGVELHRGRPIFASLGNLVFYQPQREWTQVGLGAELIWSRRDSIRLDSVRLFPVRAGYQPYFITTPEDVRRIGERVRRLSTVPVTINESESCFLVDLTDDRP